MDEKPKIIAKLEWLWLLLGVIFFLEAIVFSRIFLYTDEDQAVSGMQTVCLPIFILAIILFILFGLLSISKWCLIEKGGKKAINGGVILSIISLFVFVWPTGYLIWFGFEHGFPIGSWHILLYILLFLILIFNIVIMIVSSRPQVKEFAKAPTNRK